MSIFDIFKNEEKERIKANAELTKVIQNLIAKATMSCKTPEVLAVIRELKTEIDTHTETSSTKAIELASTIKEALETSIKHLKGDIPANATIKLFDALDAAIDRGAYCSISVQSYSLDKKTQKLLDKAKRNAANNAEDTLDTQATIDNLDIEKITIEKKYKKLQDLAKEYPNSASIKSRLKSLETKHQALKANITNTAVAQQGNEANEAAGNVAEYANNLANSSVTPEEISRTKADLDAAQGRINDISIATTGLQDALKVSATGAGLASSASGGLDEGFGSSFGAGLDESFGGTSTLSSPQASQIPSASSEDLREEKRNLDRSIKEVNEQIKAYNEKVEECLSEYELCSKELEQTLKRWQAAPPATKFTFETKIKQLKSKRARLMNDSKRYTSELARLDGELTILENTSREMGIQANEIRIAERSGGQNINYNEMAVNLHDKIQEANRKLQEMNTNLVIIDEPVIETEFGGAYGSDAFDAGLNAGNENQFADLLQEFGLQ